MRDFALLSDLDGTLIDSKASVVRAFKWWAELRGLDPAVVDRLPHGRTSTDAAAELAPDLDAEAEGKLLDERQRLDTGGVVALVGAREVLERYEPLAVVTSCPEPLARARLTAARLPTPRVLVTPELWARGKPDPEPYLIAGARLGVTPDRCLVLGFAFGALALPRVIARYNAENVASGRVMEKIGMQFWREQPDPGLPGITERLYEKYAP